MQGMFKERISLTFLGLSMIDVLIVMVFGNDKRETLEKFLQRVVKRMSRLDSLSAPILLNGHFL